MEPAGRAPYRDLDPPLPPTSMRRVARWRWTSSFAGVLLACTLFMPAVKGCDSVIVPSNELRKELPSATGIRDLAGLFLLFLAPYLFGALSALAAFGRDRHASWARHVAWGALLVAALALLIATVAAISDGVAPAALVVLLVAIYFCSSFGLGRHAPMRATVIFAAACTLWFALFSLDGYYGVRLSFVGAALLLAGSIGEGWGTLGRKLFW